MGMYNLTQRKYEEYAPPPATVIQTQLGDCWPYISGGGYQEGTEAIWVYRNGEWLVFDSRGNIDQIGEFKNGDSVSLHAVQSCFLESANRQLTTGWNDFTWQGAGTVRRTRIVQWLAIGGLGLGVLMLGRKFMKTREA